MGFTVKLSRDAGTLGLMMMRKDLDINNSRAVGRMPGPLFLKGENPWSHPTIFETQK
jgi:hypothetical protein